MEGDGEKQVAQTDPSTPVFRVQTRPKSTSLVQRVITPGNYPLGNISVIFPAPYCATTQRSYDREVGVFDALCCYAYRKVQAHRPY
jgi:hypothetical protein